MSKKKQASNTGGAAASNDAEEQNADGQFKGAPQSAIVSQPNAMATQPTIPSKLEPLQEPGLLIARNDALTRELAEAHRRADDNMSKLMLVAADYDNFKKFSDRDKHEAVANERSCLLVQFICVLENMERALDAGRKSLPPESPLMKGLQMTLDGARDLLKREGVQAIDTCGKKFDPALHDAVYFVPDTVKPEYVIVEEIQRGYTLEGKVLKASKVAVVTRPPAPCGADARDDGGSGDDAQKSKEDKETSKDDKDRSKGSK
jgi:molecular chaperone GrpE